MLVQPFFHGAHQQNSKNDRNDVTLIADLLNVKEEQMPDGDFAGGVAADGPGVDESRVNHHKTDDGTEENVAAEDAGGADGDQNGQEREGGIGDQIQEGEPVAGTKGGPEFRDCFHNTHHQAGGHDGGQDGNEHVAGGLENLLPQGHTGGRGGLHVGLGRGAGASDSQKLVIDLVHGAGADDKLELSVGLKHALDAVHVLQRFLVDLAVICDNEPQSGGAVRSADDVRSAAYVGGDFFSAFAIIECHRCFLLFPINPKNCGCPTDSRLTQISYNKTLIK